MMRDIHKEILFFDPQKQTAMKENILLFCSLFFVAALFIADITNAKLVTYSLFGITFMVPCGTLAFACTFLATDVICEITGNRQFANKVVFTALFLRVLAVLYYHLIIGDAAGNVPFLNLSSLWTPEKQEHLSFILGAGGKVAVAGICAVTVSFLLDTYAFTWLRKKLLNRNLYWFRNGITTTLAQIINSTIFISLAFSDVLTAKQIELTILGQIILKALFAWADTPLALILRNYGQGRKYWYAFWKKDFYLG